MYRTSRRDYVIRKQADYGQGRWTIHYRKKDYAEPWAVARVDTRQQARDLVSFLMEVDQDRYDAFMLEVAKGAWSLKANTA